MLTMKTLLLAVAVIAVGMIVVDASGRGSGFHGRPPFPFPPRGNGSWFGGFFGNGTRPDFSFRWRNGTYYKWNVTLSSGQNQTASAFIPNGTNIIIYLVRNLARNQTTNESKTVEYYQNGTAYSITSLFTRLGRVPSVLRNIVGKTFADAIAALNSRNGTTISSPPVENVNATGPALTRDQIKTLNVTCRGGIREKQIVNATAFNEAELNSRNDTVQFTTYDGNSLATFLIVRSTPAPARFGKGRFHGHGKGHHGGHSNNNSSESDSSSSEER